ncbi:putative ABC transport system permease protein [Allocatelliglobosispora scoriae]|uniref:Putative ABC transport system permease protein n=1 Tax=Allocatelliglobosispora scoriae TaxID=643052 RepID=A0A841BXM2_9ACTN|nr:FtsX-like permease family protein [Allocatelliglobosispora scoriae]MBB5872276.1 putative ABC transport system permease protein [Allocatelliglobosispora scoriae]
MSWLRSWAVSLRIARREARRNRGRSLLVLAMIGLPVLGLSFAAVSYDMFNLTRPELIERRLGAADALVSWAGGPVNQLTPGSVESGGSDKTPPEIPTTAEIEALFPAGSRAVSIMQGTAQMRTATGIGNVSAFALTIADPVTAGMVTLLDGVPPRSDTEVALTPQAAARLGAVIGGTVRTTVPDRAFTVTALVEMPEQLSEYIFFRAEAMPSPDGVPLRSSEWLMATPTPLGLADIGRLNAAGLRVMPRDVALNASLDEFTAQNTIAEEELTLGVIVIGMAIFEIVLLAGPAFAVGARRRQRELALVAAAGGTPAQVRRIVLADGVVLGAVGAVLGIVAGVALAFGGRPLIEEYLVGSRAGGYRFFPLALAGIVILAIGTGLLAALVPAFTAARQSVIAALSGRRGIVRSRTRWIVVGAVLLVVSSLVAVAGALVPSPEVILVGLILGQFSLALLTPSLVGVIGRLGSRLPLAPRIALRDTARNRASAAPAISAVMAVVAGSVMIGIFMNSQNIRNNSYHVPSGPLGSATIGLFTWGPAGQQRMGEATMRQIEARLRESLPVDRTAVVAGVSCRLSGADPDSYQCPLDPVVPPEQLCPFAERPPTPEEMPTALDDPRCRNGSPGTYSGLHNVVDDGGNLALITGGEAADVERAVAMLRSGGVVVSDERFLSGGKVTLRRTDTVDGQADGPLVTVPAYAMTTGARSINLIMPPSALPQLAAAFGGSMTSDPAYLFATTREMPTTAEVDGLNQAMQEIDNSIYPIVEQGADGEFDPTLLILALASALITLAAAGVATGLAAADGRSDLATLAAVGASPRLRRTLSLSQSGVIAGLGTLLGVIAGVGGAFAIIKALNVSTAEAWPVPMELPLAVPWGNLVTVFVVPLVAMLGAGLLTRSRLPIERRSQ